MLPRLKDPEALAAWQRRQEGNKWKPSSEQYTRFITRERELCAALRTRSPGIIMSETLFSPQTWLASAPS